MAKHSEVAVSVGKLLTETLVPESRVAGLVASRLSASVLNIDAKRRSNLLPWRGQFSPQLVEALLRAYAAENSVVLDPFMGSGTVLVESARLGHSVYGYEVNPAAYLLSRIYELCVLTSGQRHELLRRTESVLDEIRPCGVNLPLFGAERVGSITPNGHDWIRSCKDPVVRLLCEALVVLVDGAPNINAAYATKWSIIRKVVTELPVSWNPVSATLGDARALQLGEATVDFVLTSPPYINVFNYHNNSRLAIESLGWKPLIVARSEIGSNRKYRQNRFLTVVQYCIDMAMVLAEIRRVCRSDAQIVLIMGRESNVQKTAFYNGQIVERIAREIVGLQLELQQQRVFLNKFGKHIHEELLHLGLKQCEKLSMEAVIDGARKIGVEVLAGAVSRTPQDRRSDLREAITRAEEVSESPIFEPAAAIGA